jgi:AcrR family transcriptional regulator
VDELRPGQEPDAELTPDSDLCQTMNAAAGQAALMRSTVPTGVGLRDAREQLFGAAERVLLREGPSALTSRAVTKEAGVAKGVLHRHFIDFDTFLAELVLDRIAQIDNQAAALRNCAGTGTVADNLTGALIDLFAPVALGILALVTSRHELLARLRHTTPRGIPILSETTTMIASYLTAEQQLGRITADADIDTLAPMLIGTGHLLFAGREGTPPPAHAVHRAVTVAIAGALIVA